MAQPAEKGGKTVLSVTDFGPIARADIDLRPLTILAGPSNTGKSYLATLIYALSKCFSRNYPDDSGWRPDYRSLERRRLHPRVGHMLDDLWSDVPREGKALLAEWLQKTKAHLREDGRGPYPDFLQDMLRNAYGKSLGSGKEIAYELETCFGTNDVRNLTRHKSRNPAAASVSFFDASDSKTADFEFRLNPSGTVGHGAISPGFVVDASDPERNVLWRLDRQRGLSEERLPQWAFHEMYGASRAPRIDLASPAHFFPADRTGIMHAHRVVVGSLVKSATHAGIGPGIPTPSLSGVVGDFLTGLIYMEDREGPLCRHGKSIESEILGGEIHVERDRGTGYPGFFYRPDGWKAEAKIPLVMASSMVSELASMVLCLRHVVAKGDLLIIEEPEAHLHPAMQAELAVHLARLVRAGVRVIVTTHSQYVVEQFANLVALSRLPRERILETVMDYRRITGAGLEESMVGAWLFVPKRRPAGSVVREIPLDPESGDFPVEFSDVSLHLHNEGGVIENLSKAVSSQ